MPFPLTTFVSRITVITRDWLQSVNDIVGNLSNNVNPLMGAGLIGYDPGLAYLVGTVGEAIQRGGGIVSVKTYGALGDGVQDDAPAFRDAVTALTAVGGGLLYVPAGLYRLATHDSSYEISKDQWATFNLTSNIELVGEKNAKLWLDGATLCLVAPFAAPVYNRFDTVGIRRGATNCAVRNLEFTTNGWVLDYGFRSCLAVNDNGDYTVMEDLRCVDMPGRNVIVVGQVYQPVPITHPTFTTKPVGTRISRCVFLQGGRNIVGNTLSDDLSFIYTSGYDIHITACTFKNSSAAVHNCGGIEIHSSTSRITDCYFENLWPAIFTGWQDRDIFDAFVTTAVGNKVLNNTIVDCMGGVFLVAPHNDLEIAGNSFINAGVPNADGLLPIGTTRLNTTGVSSGVQYNVQIHDNTFTHSQTFSDARYQRSQIAVAGLQGAGINDNLFSGISEPINLLLASDVATDSVVVTGNKQVYPYATPAYTTGLLIMGGYDGGVYTSMTGSIAGTVMTVTAVASGTIYVGQTIAGAGVAVGTKVIALGTGTGGTGTYTVDIAQVVGATALTSNWEWVGTYSGVFLKNNTIVSAPGDTLNTMMVCAGDVAHTTYTNCIKEFNNTVNCPNTLSGSMASYIKDRDVPWTAYNPTWSVSGAVPFLGNGSLVGNYMRIGDTVRGTIQLTIGGTTLVAGSLLWYFSLPVLDYYAGNVQMCGVCMVQLGTGAIPTMTGVVRVSGGNQKVEMFFDKVTAFNSSTLTQLGEATRVWAAGDSIQIQFEYQAA